MAQVAVATQWRQGIESAGRVGKLCREREAAVNERRQSLDTPCSRSDGRALAGRFTRVAAGDPSWP